MPFLFFLDFAVSCMYELNARNQEK
uniref:Uncharacterized protein n=1 Tax=Rhizophora mucronata TaxID=61149 RepID=A0A2P2JZV5_RHIMU